MAEQERKHNENFSYASLSDSDKQIYDALPERKQITFENNWVRQKKAEAKLAELKKKQAKVAASAKTKERKEDSHNKIMCGGIVAKHLGRKLTKYDYILLSGFIASRGGFFSQYMNSEENQKKAEQIYIEEEEKKKMASAEKRKKATKEVVNPIGEELSIQHTAKNPVIAQAEQRNREAMQNRPEQLSKYAQHHTVYPTE